MGTWYIHVEKRTVRIMIPEEDGARDRGAQVVSYSLQFTPPATAHPEAVALSPWARASSIAPPWDVLETQVLGSIPGLPTQKLTGLGSLCFKKPPSDWMFALV